MPIYSQELPFNFTIKLAHERPTGGAPGALQIIVGPNISPNGRLYANPWRASASHGLSEWSERMRAERGPMSAQILGLQYIARRARTGC